MEMNNSESDPVHNELGIIAESYRDLQGLHILTHATVSPWIQRASHASAIRAVFQSVEVALLNLGDLLVRCTADIVADNYAKSSEKLSWCKGFHRILIQLGTMLPTLQVGAGAIAANSSMRLAESPAYSKLRAIILEYDAALQEKIATGALDAAAVIGSQSIGQDIYAVLHLIRVCNQDAMIWERRLSEFRVPIADIDFERFVLPEVIANAVWERALRGDTFFTQFRALHQIPELLCAELNDHLEVAIRAVRDAQLQAAIIHLHICCALSQGVIAALPPIFDNLSTFEYHKIRENLGLTSGSHSVAIHYHLFRDLYGAFGRAIEGMVRAYDPRTASVGELVSRIDLASTYDQNSFLLHCIFQGALTIREFSQLWRDWHLQLPRNTLGGNATKSLTGSNDAVETVKRMRDSAAERDSLRWLAAARGMLGEQDLSLPLAAYFEQESSLDQELQVVTGGITQTNFPRVQERLGIFASRPAFVPPPKRTV